MHDSSAAHALGRAPGTKDRLPTLAPSCCAHGPGLKLGAVPGSDAQHLGNTDVVTLTTAIEARHMPATPPFRAEHIGSLLRPPGLAEMRRRRAAGEVDDPALAAAEDAAIEQAIRLQERVGL